MHAATPSNDSSSYWLEEFRFRMFLMKIYLHIKNQMVLCVNPGCPNGDSDFIQGWGNNEAQYLYKLQMNFIQIILF